MFGRAVEVNDLEERRLCCDALYEKIDWKPEEPEIQLFSIDVDSAALIEFKDEKMTHRFWQAH